MRTKVSVYILPFVFLATAAQAYGQATDDYGQWVGKPHAEWPHLALINRIEYSDASHPVAGCAFLLDTGDGIVAATAKHVLRYFKSEPMDSVSFRGTLEAWKMFPKNDPSRSIVVGKLINENENESLESGPAARDWLLFTVVEIADGIQPLRLRSTPVGEGETVFIVGWRYTDEGSQKVYRGKYVRAEEGTLLVSADELADNKIPGLSGAPVIDSQGYVIGLMSSKAGKLERLASVDYPSELLDSRLLGAVALRTATVRPVDPAPSTVTRCPLEASRCAREMAEYFRQRGWVGITPDVDLDSGVIRVDEVFPDSPAEKAGLREGDIVQGLDGVELTDNVQDAFQRVSASFRPGRTALFTVDRDGKRLEIEVRLEPIPEAILAQWVEQHLLEHH
jgi:hypothetical protein